MISVKPEREKEIRLDSRNVLAENPTGAYIVRSYIAVADIFEMSILNSLKYLEHDAVIFRLDEFLCLIEIHEVATVTKFHDLQSRGVVNQKNRAGTFKNDTCTDVQFSN